ncbi:hypothetical protein EDC15_10394 [Acetobacter aceti NBRC 14818]|nr:hypothetical protein EDC15_10394 [Acetobacter aceti NBRC 14818]
MTHASDPADGNSLGDTARKVGRNRIMVFTHAREKGC